MTTNSNPEMPEVLVLEDDPSTVSILTIWLRGIVNLTIAVDGDHALQIINDWHTEGKVFDIMLFDINIPFPWNGLTLKAEILNRWGVYRGRPFIAETAYAMPNDRHRILEAGFVDYLAKPLDRKTTTDVIRQHFPTPV
jgi:two-component system sensor histidine kinase BarA